MTDLEGDVRRYLGVPPFDGPSNTSRDDGYLYLAMTLYYGEDTVKAMIKKVKSEGANDGKR
ncbi:MAG: hypothetical protein ACWGQW_19485 [bacterium]